MVWKRWAPPLVLLALFLLLVVRLNQVDKVALVSREGQTFEKGVVTEILQDNVQPDGSRVGEQVVRVLMKTGELKGREIETTSSSGFLFGAPCTVGMKVVVMQSLAGDTVVSSVYAQDREFQILAFAALYLLALCLIGGWQGVFITVLQWAMVIFGVFYKSLSRKSIPAVSLTIYLVMGWTIVFFLPLFISHASTPLVALIALGGVLYTLGAWFYARKGFRYHHMVWHLLIDLAVAAHFAGIVFYLY